MDGIGNIPTSLPSSSMLDNQRTPHAQATPAVVSKAFDAIFATMFVKQMRQSLEENSMFEGDTSDVLGGLFDHYMGEHLAKSGGFGVGAMIRRQLERQNERIRPA